MESCFKRYESQHACERSPRGERDSGFFYTLHGLSARVQYLLGWSHFVAAVPASESVPPWYPLVWTGASRQVGALVVDDVKPYEFMKLRLLNGGHSCLSYISVLCGYNYVDDAMADTLISGEFKCLRRSMAPAGHAFRQILPLPRFITGQSLGMASQSEATYL